MYEVHTSVHLMRRKQTNVVLNDHKEPCWTGNRIFDALQYLVDNEIYTAKIVHEDRELRIMLGTVTE